MIRFVALAKRIAMNRSLLLVSLACSAQVAAQGPVFHWPLDESSGTVAHAWGGSDGVLAGGTLWAPNGGYHQGCARFDGVDDRILLGPCDITTGTGGITLSLWAKADFVTGMDRTLIAKATGPNAADHSWSIAFVSGTGLRFRLRTAGNVQTITTPPSSLFGGQWYHIAGVYDGSEMRLYLNGSVMGTAPASGLIGTSPQAPASLGALSTGLQPFSGWIDDVRIYDHALSDAEIIDVLLETMTTGIAEVAHPLLADDMVRVPSGSHRLTVRDALGRLLYENTLRGPATIPLPTAGAGMRLVCLEGDGGGHVARVVSP